MFNLNSYGELALDDVNVYDFEFPLTAEEYEDAINERIAMEESAHELAFHQYHSC